MMIVMWLYAVYEQCVYLRVVLLSLLRLRQAFYMNILVVCLGACIYQSYCVLSRFVRLYIPGHGNIVFSIYCKPFTINKWTLFFNFTINNIILSNILGPKYNLSLP